MIGRLAAVGVAMLLTSAARADLDGPPGSSSARAIAEAAHENWTRHDTSARLHIRVVARTGRSYEQRVEVARRRVGGQPRSLIRLVHPPDLRGTTVLVLENESRDDDRFLFLPASRRIRRIAAADRRERFLGTDLLYADLGAGDLEAWRFERLPDALEAGVPCYVVLSVDRNPGVHAEQRRLWITQDRFVTLRIEYERHGRLVRRMRVDPEAIEPAGEGAWLPRRLVMRNLVRGSRTEVVVQTLRVDPDLPDELFSLASLERIARRGEIAEREAQADEERPGR